MQKMQSKILKFVALVAIICIAFTVFPATLLGTEWFVSREGSNDAGDGTINNPYRTIVFAMAIASPRDTITVMPGLYIDGPTALDKEIYLRSQMGPDTTILTGTLKTGIFTLGDNSYSTVIEGFTLSDAINAIEIQYCSPIIRDNKFLNNITLPLPAKASSNGAALDIYYAQPEIYDNYFFNNVSAASGGAIYASYSQPQIHNNVFENNSVTGTYYHGGAIMIDFSYPDTVAIVIQNNIFSKNSADMGGALSVAYSSCYVYNNVFYGNTAGNYAGGLLVEYGFDPYVYNNIFLGNQPDGMGLNDYPITNYDNNDYYGNTPNNGCSGCPVTPSTYFMDPQFVDAGNGDFHLTGASGLINKGRSTLAHLLNFDLDYENRNIAGSVDIGADEFADCNLSGNFGALTDTAGCPGLAVQFSALNLQGYYDALTWNFGDGASAYNILNPSHIYRDTGTFTVELLMSTPCTTVVISKSNYVHIMETPLPDFQSDVQSGCIPLSVSFENLTAGTADSYLWDFGDGGSSQEVNPVHVYQEAGQYTVKLKAYNSCGEDSVVMIGYVDALSGAVSEFRATPTTGSAPLTVNFTDLSLYSPITWFWDFGDGGSDIESNPTYRFLFPGIYDVMLVTENDCGTQPDTLIKPDYITIYGFESMVYNTLEIDRYNFRYDFYEDTLYGLFERTISPKGAMAVNPSRGRVTFSFGDSTLSVFDSTNLRATLTKDVPRGTYDFYLITTGSGGSPVDTLPLQFTSTADSLLETTPLALDFGEVPQDSAKNLTLTVRNNIQFPDTFSVTVTNITTSPSVFSSNFSGQFRLDAVTKTRQVQVSFAPADLGAVNGVLTIFSNDPAYPQWDVSLSGTGIVERTPPAVDSTKPYIMEKEFPVTDSLTIYYTEPIDQSTLQPGSITITSLKSGNPIAGEWIYNLDNNVSIFKPTGGFAVLDSIRVVLNGNIADLAGNTLDGNGDGQGTGAPGDNYIFDFTTGLAVYPGDANNDGIVNEMDVLPLGVYWEAEGDPRRGDAHIWTRQAATSWDPVRATYADCNGDGIINGSDVEIIQNNWGLTHVIEGSPTVFTMDELNENAESFNDINNTVEVIGAGESGDKMHDLLSGYITEQANIEHFSLGRNFPNPFNPVTTIDFTIPRECHVTLEVYNVLGQTVKMLVDETLPSGYGSVTWDGTDGNGNPVPSGVYFYRMTADEFSKVRKMLLIR
jgi:PKD repeat protein